MNKKSFVLYFDLCAVFEQLTDEQAGQLIKEITKYAASKTKDNQNEPSRLFGLLEALSTPFKNHIDRDFQAWLERAKIMRENGKKGGRPQSKKTKTNQNKAVTVTVTDTVSVTNLKKENIIKEKRLSDFLKERGQDPDRPDDIDWPDEWLDFAKAEFPDLPEQEIFTQLCRMLDWSRNSKNGKKLDWMATWRNWIRGNAPDILLRIQREKREASYGKK